MEQELAKSLDALNKTLQKMAYKCSDCWYYIGDWKECVRPDGNGDYMRMEMEPNDFCSKFYRPEWYLTGRKGGV